MLAPARTQPEIVRVMNNETKAPLNGPEVRDSLVGQCIAINTGTPEVARTFIDGQIDTCATEVVREINIGAE